ncbi:hypothetical protein AWH56_002285 [Anaerobacillus isosaccharinicus]|uniref:Uncharacterized protein n=1 Tax=Anaerobacillus isosaccharinicus TaxID=1532552 RepID=A0A1S2LLK3_9BACI|nr:hypothetical protein [Anaerobacillus isosaccharinicus]MBA5585127.1 hypothetical protein [Anaerobacillus isosaccharinicus]QOY36530.1 hypothetical protein AWH56_002285 [Anaerobacillus isosaccharinicus]
MSGRFKIPQHWKVNTHKFLRDFQFRWYSFWKNWHYVKYYFYNSSRHLVKTRKFRRKLRGLRK